MAIDRLRTTFVAWKMGRIFTWFALSAEKTDFFIRWMRVNRSESVELEHAVFLGTRGETFRIIDVVIIIGGGSHISSRNHSWNL